MTGLLLPLELCETAEVGRTSAASDANAPNMPAYSQFVSCLPCHSLGSQMIQLYGHGEAPSIKGGNSRESSALLEAHVMDEILHRIRRVDGFEVKSVNS